MTEQNLQPGPRAGGCLCGAVRYTVQGPLRPVVACHCGQCRKTSGHYVAATAASRDHLVIVADSGLKWFRSSDFARRGFCRECGSSLFWERDGKPDISIMAGTLEGPTGLSTALHICIEDAGDYYVIPEGEPGQEGRAHALSAKDEVSEAS